MSLPRLNPVEPPWYGPVCPVVGEGWHREVPPYPDPGEFQRLVRNDNQESAHAQEATDRQNGIWLLAVRAHQEVVNLTDGFVGIVDDATANDLGRAIAGRQLLHIDLDEL